MATVKAQREGRGVRLLLNKRKRLANKEVKELVDLLRKNLVYQTPRPLFAALEDEHPTHVEVRMLFQHHQRILELLHKAGGWTLPPDEKAKVMARHEEAARVAYGDGVNYDLSHLSFGDLVGMHAELEGVPEMKPFRDAIADAMKERSHDA
jgi:hypothetical protein